METRQPETILRAAVLDGAGTYSTRIRAAFRIFICKSADIWCSPAAAAIGGDFAVAGAGLSGDFNYAAALLLLVFYSCSLPGQLRRR